MYLVAIDIVTDNRAQKSVALYFEDFEMADTFSSTFDKKVEMVRAFCEPVGNDRKFTDFFPSAVPFANIPIK